MICPPAIITMPPMISGSMRFSISACFARAALDGLLRLALELGVHRDRRHHAHLENPVVLLVEGLKRLDDVFEAVLGEFVDAPLVDQQEDEFNEQPGRALRDRVHHQVVLFVRGDAMRTEKHTRARARRRRAWPKLVRSSCT